MCRGIPEELTTLLRYAKALNFEQRPNYDLIIKLLDIAATNYNIDLSDGIFDWSIKAIILKKYP